VLAVAKAQFQAASEILLPTLQSPSNAPSNKDMLSPGNDSRATAPTQRN